MTKSQVIEILKGLMMEEVEIKHFTQFYPTRGLEDYDKKELASYWFNLVVREQNAKIQAVIDRLAIKQAEQYRR